MTDRTSQTGMDCTQFEALLADALDNLAALTPAVQREFEAHRLSCGNCGPLWAEVREGMLMLDSLEELEPPKNLVHNILVATSHAQEAEAGAGTAVKQPSGIGRRAWLGWASVRPVLSSRFAMSFGMAFFSIGLTLSALGVNMKDVGHLVAHPTMLRKTVVLQYTSAQARVQRYYDNLRLVYEVETRVQNLKKAQPGTENNETKPGPQNRSTPPDTSSQPQHENYSRELDGSLLARSTWKNEGAQI